MASESITIRNARPEEAERLATIEAQCWPADTAANAEQFASRLRIHPEGQWVAELDGRVVGVSVSQRITEAFLLREPVREDRLTDSGSFARSHDPDGDIYQLITVSVAPEGRGFRLGRRLVDRQLASARGLPSVRRIVGFTRPAGFHRHPDMTIEDYIALRDDGGRWVDAVLDFHLRAGARVVSVHPGYRPADEAARGYGVLIEYPMEA